MYQHVYILCIKVQSTGEDPRFFCMGIMGFVFKRGRSTSLALKSKAKEK